MQTVFTAAPKLPATSRRTLLITYLSEEKFSLLILDLDDEDNSFLGSLEKSFMPSVWEKRVRRGCPGRHARSRGPAQTPIYAHMGKGLQDKAAKSSAIS